MKNLSLRQIGLPLLSSTALVLFMAPPVVAEDFVVSTATTVFNGGNTIDGGDSLTVTAGGSIDTTVAMTNGVYGTNGNNIVVNAGIILTDGNNARGIRLTGEMNTISNAGSITTLGFAGYGIRVGKLNIINNSGNITTMGTFAAGIFATDESIINNSGSILTEGVLAAGIHVSDKNVVSNSGSITTVNGGSNGVIFEGFENTLTNSASIVTSGVGSNGVFVQNDKNTMENSGVIDTGGDGANGIYIFSGEENNVMNSGSIDVGGVDAAGIRIVSNKNTVINTGSVKTSGDFATDGAHGVDLLGDMNALMNSGNIATSGVAAFGVNMAGTGNSFTNSGVVSTSGEKSNGVTGGSINQLVNAGSILTSGAGAEGVSFGTGGADLANPDIINTGIIHTTGAGAVGLFANGSNVITHSGYLVSEQDHSLYIDGRNTTINLLAPAYIGGNIHMDDITAVHIATGRSHSNLWDFSDHGADFTIDFIGPVPWAWDAVTEQFASLDPTALSAASDVLSDKVGSLSDLLRINHGGAGAGNMVAADLAVVQYQALIAPQEAEYVAPPKPIHQYDGEWWLAGYGNFADRGASGIYNDYTHLNGGIAVGASFVLDENWDVGGFVGYQASNLVVNSRWLTSQTVFGQGIVGGITANFEHDGWFADIALFGGWTFNNSDRFVNDNLMAPLGADHALADYNSFFLAPELRVGVDIDSGEDWTLTPSATARFSNQWIEGYAETGSNANATFAGRVVQVFEAEIELAATNEIEMDNGENALFTLRGGIDYSQYVGPATTNIVLLGQTLAEPLNTAGVFGAFVGAEVNFNLSHDVSLDLAAKGSLNAAGYAIGGSIGISGLF